MFESVDHLLLHLTEPRNELRNSRKIVRPGDPGQHRGAVLGKRVRLCRGVVVNNAAGDHTTEPFPYISFVQPGGIGNLCAGGRGKLGERVDGFMTGSPATFKS